MEPELSLPKLLASLEMQIAYHREQEASHAEQEGAHQEQAAFHAEREAFHREQRAAHAAEAEQLARHLEALNASAAAAAGLARRALPAGAPTPAAAPEPPADPAPGRRLSLNAAVMAVVARKGPDQRFGPNEVTEEVNRHFAGRLGGPVEVRQVSVALRWLAANRQIALAARGRQRKESKYARLQRG